MTTLRDELAEIVRKHVKVDMVFVDLLLAAFEARLPQEKDLYEGMVCQDFEHCIPAYDETPGERAEYNHAIADVKAILGGTE